MRGARVWGDAAEIYGHPRLASRGDTDDVDRSYEMGEVAGVL